MSDDDPLEAADIGDTETVTVTRELWVGNLEADACRGSDRLADSEIVATEIVTNEHGEEHLAVTVESEITKRLPHRWDACQQPRTETEHREARRSVWKRQVKLAAPVFVVSGVLIAIMHRVSTEVAAEGITNSDPMGAVSLVPVVLLVMFFALIIVALPYLPGMAGVGR